jgi:hypothetical protein
MQVLKKKSTPPLDDAIVKEFEQVKTRMAEAPHTVDGRKLVKFKTELFEGFEYAPARLEILAALHLLVTNKISRSTAARLVDLSRTRIDQYWHRRERHLKQTAYQRRMLTQSEGIVITAITLATEKYRNINAVPNPHYELTHHTFATQVALREIFLAAEEKIKESPEDWAVVVGCDQQSVIKAVGFKPLVQLKHSSVHWAFFAFDADLAYNPIVQRRMDLALQEVVERSYLIQALAPLCTPKVIRHDSTPI